MSRMVDKATIRYDLIESSAFFEDVTIKDSYVEAVGYSDSVSFVISFNAEAIYKGHKVALACNEYEDFVDNSGRIMIPFEALEIGANDLDESEFEILQEMLQSSSDDIIFEMTNN